MDAWWRHIPAKAPPNPYLSTAPEDRPLGWMSMGPQPYRSPVGRPHWNPHEALAWMVTPHAHAKNSWVSLMPREAHGAAPNRYESNTWLTVAPKGILPPPPKLSLQVQLQDRSIDGEFSALWVLEHRELEPLPPWPKGPPKAPSAEPARPKTAPDPTRRFRLYYEDNPDMGNPPPFYMDDGRVDPYFMHGCFNPRMEFDDNAEDYEACVAMMKMHGLWGRGASSSGSSGD